MTPFFGDRFWRCSVNDSRIRSKTASFTFENGLVWTGPETFHDMQITVARATQLCRPNVEFPGFRHTDRFRGNGHMLRIFCFRMPANSKQAWPECHIYRLRHRKCDVQIFIHELQNFGKRTSERSERVSFPKFCNS